ncbi:MAG: hypothetical protein CVU39_23545 [Chloroflexi bacterium HGW-Chloroflexi-10]|nr:MAG: hypothetical protein CVU39_23545 [Chloroflexi bacterium HGW-Chloroflexi-10]
MVTQKQKHCPICQSNDQLISVHDLYFAWIEKDQAFLSKLPLDYQAIRKLIPYIKPPEIQTQPFWKVIHPDILASVVIFALVYVNFDQALKQAENWLVYAGISCGILAAFLLLRKTILQKFDHSKENRKQEIQKRQLVMDEWLTLCVCFRDMILVSENSNSPLHLKSLK